MTNRAGDTGQEGPGPQWEPILRPSGLQVEGGCEAAGPAPSPVHFPEHRHSSGTVGNGIVRSARFLP